MCDSVPSYFRYWGKAEEDGRYHLLPYHCLDVAAVGWVLLGPSKPLCRRLARCLEIPPELFQRFLACFLCLHDIGKFAVAFQGLVPSLSTDLIPSNGRKSYTTRHDSLGYALWADVEEGLYCRLESADPFEWFLDRQNGRQLFRTLDLWMQIVTGHHGVPPKTSTLYLSDFFDKQDEEAAYQYLLAILKLFASSNTLEVMTDKDFFKRLKDISWNLAGLVVLADWLGSSRQADSFLQHVLPLEDYWSNYALPFAESAVRNAGLESSAIAPYAGINRLFPFISAPTPLQHWADSVELVSGNQLFILEDVTGSGKTEAALTLAHRLMAGGLADGLYVALPTMATASAMYERLGKAYRSLYADNAFPSLILAHGARHLSDAFRKTLVLPENRDVRSRYDKEEETVEAFCSAWFADSRKKALLAEVGVGTLDQALLAVLPARHQSLRCLGLSRKVLIVDEVHAYDPYMNQLLQALLEFHASQGGSAILLSATLPYEMRMRYVQAYCNGIGRELPPLMEEKHYPLATHFPAIKDVETAMPTRREVDRTVAVELVQDEKEVLSLIRMAVESGRCVCWVRNTVGDAIRTYRHLAEQKWLDKEKLSLFHSRFAMIDRQLIEAATLDYFGDKSTAEKRRDRVLIATQVVEQSLDLDFDMMISDLAPIDLLIQRLGREYRHVRKKEGDRLYDTGASDLREPPVFYLFGPPVTETPEENWLKSVLPGTQAVYRNVGQLWLAQQLLAEAGTLSMPADARTLIEGVYGDEAQDSIPDSLRELSYEAVADAYAELGIARMNALKFSKGYSRASAEDSGGWGEEVNIPTRLGGKTVRVALVVPTGEGWKPYADDTEFPWDMSMLDVPQGIWRTACEEIPENVRESLVMLKEEHTALRWAEPFPLIPELSGWYSLVTGWGFNKEETDESD